ncbi:MAG: phytanoyl-CoA dioxygenase family protein [Anaerolineae bacterium]|nr:phytanoyl-CoA dioxygenase family protein [Anaerolineae bacterium]
MHLSPEQCLHFQTEGYLIVPDFFDQGMVKLLRLEMERLVAEDRGRNVMPAFTGKINYLITPLADKSTLFRELPNRPEVVGVVEQLLGGAAALILDQIFLKPARVGAGNSWHLDNGRFQLADPTRGLGMWITLHEASRANGTLELIPRSHLLPPETFTPPGQYLPVPPDESLAVPMVAAAGGVIFFNFGILHCTHDNPSDRDRAALVYHFARDG